MKLTIKTLQQSTFKVDIEEDKSVKDLKVKIETDHGKESYPSDAQKLIYSGKILADECKLSEYNIDEKKFIVLMITRPPPTPKIHVNTEKPASGVKKEDPASAKQQPKTTQQTDDKSKAPAVSTTSSSSSTVSSLANSLTSPNTTTTTTSTALQQQASRPTSGGRTGTGANDTPLSANLGEPQMASRLAAMMTQPHFRQIQDLIQQSPHLLSSTIEALAGSDPEMYSFISENPDVFVSALNHPPMAGSRGPSSRSSTTTTTTSAHSGNQPSQQVNRNQTGRPPMVDQLLVSDHDKEAIERLKELGFPEFLAVQAYIACDKDEQLAANLLFQMEQ